MRPSISFPIARSLYSDISISLARFLFWTISHFFMYHGDYSPCVGKLEIVGFLTQTSVQRQRRCPAKSSLGTKLQYAWTLRSGANHVKSHLRMFSGGELWATDEQTRDLSDVRKTTTQRLKGCITFILTSMGLGRTAVNPTAPSLYFPIFRCLRPGLCFGQDQFFHVPWGLLTMRW